jgi:hypothetical protein
LSPVRAAYRRSSISSSLSFGAILSVGGFPVPGVTVKGS